MRNIDRNINTEKPTNLTRSDVARPEVTRSGAVRSDAVRPEMPRSDVARSEVPRPDVIRSNVTRSEVTRSDVIRPDVTRPEVTQPDVTRTDVTQKAADIHSAEYLRGYRDGVRERQVAARPQNGGDGILGALLAIALLAGVGYFGYNYATTGRLLPAEVELNNFLAPSPASQP